jgi:regulator of RNase E activity RraA
MKLLLTLFSTCLAVSTLAQANLTDEQILKLYEGLRVADVSDGMDMVGLRDAGLMDQRIEPLWKDTDNMKHIISGIAVTARYIPTVKVVKNPMAREEFQKWEGDWYGKYSTEAYVEFIKPGSIVVLDVQGDGDTGSVGSNNGLNWVSKGARGIISNGGIRDTDEIIKQRIPVYLDFMSRGRGIRPGRNELESVNKPVTVGGVVVRPGDVIVADGDGVICVPREFAKPVAEFAHEILTGDKKARRALYEKLGMPLDKTVQDN